MIRVLAQLRSTVDHAPATDCTKDGAQGARKGKEEQKQVFITLVFCVRCAVLLGRFFCVQGFCCNKQFLHRKKRAKKPAKQQKCRHTRPSQKICGDFWCRLGWPPLAPKFLHKRRLFLTKNSRTHPGNIEETFWSTLPAHWWSSVLARVPPNSCQTPLLSTSGCWSALPL